MGKVLKAVIAIVAIAAIAYFAPGLGLGALHAFGFTSVVAGSAAAMAAGAVVAAGLTAGVGLLSRAIFASAPHTSTAPGRQASSGQPLERLGLTMCYPPDPPIKSVAPILEPWWRDRLFLPWERYALQRTTGNCMVPILPAGRTWVVVDRRAPIQRGDICLLRPDDIRDYLRGGGGDPRNSAGLVKRFVGFDPERRVVVYETTNPPNRIETGIERVQHLYRVASWHRSRFEAIQAYLRLRRG